MAYVNAKPAGLIQYQPKPEEKILEIEMHICSRQTKPKERLGKALLNALMTDAKKPKEIFNNKPRLALVTWAFNIPDTTRKMSFT